MKVSELLPKARRVKAIRDSSFREWQKATRPIADDDVYSIGDNEADDYIYDNLNTTGWQMKHKVCNNTMIRRLHLLSGIWNRGINKGIIDCGNPWRGKAAQVEEMPDKEYEYRDFDFYKPYHEDPIFLAIWYHGFRRSEICGLKQGEIKWESGIQYFHIKDNELRQIKRCSKKRSPNRKVPVHPEFAPYVNKLQTDWTSDPGKQWSSKFHNAMNLDPGEAAHSIRHNFITRCRSVRMGEEYIAHIVGHEPMGMTSRYGSFLLDDSYSEIIRVPTRRERKRYTVT